MSTSIYRQYDIFGALYSNNNRVKTTRIIQEHQQWPQGAITNAMGHLPSVSPTLQWHCAFGYIYRNIYYKIKVQKANAVLCCFHFVFYSTITQDKTGVLLVTIILVSENNFPYLSVEWRWKDLKFASKTSTIQCMRNIFAGTVVLLFFISRPNTEIQWFYIFYSHFLFFNINNFKFFFF